MANAAEAAATEIEAALTEQGPLTEGLRDFGRLNLEGPASATIAQVLADYVRRQELLETAFAALNALIADGYPALDARTVAEGVFDDLKANRDTINAAFEKFNAEPAAVNLNPTVGTTEPKDGSVSKEASAPFASTKSKRARF